MTSIRNAPIDVASARIVHYLRTHNYDECALYINRLSSTTFRKILSTDLSIDNLLAQLPFSIEIFEVIYSKIFIHDADTFPIRLLKPEQIISRMISIFASMFDNTTTVISKSINDEHLLSNLSSILRIISYVQPVLFKRLLRQKETIDECVLFFQQRLSMANTTGSSTMPVLNKNLEETIRQDLESTINCCQQAIQRLESKPRLSRSSSAHSTPIITRKHSTLSAVQHSPSSFDDIQNRLFQHKALLNLVEPYLSQSKLYSVMDHLGQKVSMDKQILLAYAHIKSHEKQIPMGEPLLPLFKRFAFAYERKSINKHGMVQCSLLLGIIQLWRRVTDSSLIDECTDDIVVDNTSSGICFERARSRKYLLRIKTTTTTTVRERNPHCSLSNDISFSIYPSNRQEMMTTTMKSTAMLKEEGFLFVVE